LLPFPIFVVTIVIPGAMSVP